MKDVYRRRGQGGAILAVIGTAFLLFVLVAAIYAFQASRPWWEKKTGEAEYARADQNRRIAVLEATARHEAAVELALAEVERAKGVAAANTIIGASLRDNEQYLRYLWITDVAGASVDKTVVYVATEANLPILEAGRMKP